MTSFDKRFRSLGYLLPAIGYGFCLCAIGLTIGWFVDTPLIDRNNGQPESLATTILLVVASSLIGGLFMFLGSKIRRAYRQGRRSGF